MRLFESIIDANHRAVNGDLSAGVHVGNFVDELPLVALTCIDPRLNRLFPGVLGLPEEQFIWLRNAGNIITSPLSSTMRSIALACTVKGGREVALIGHSDCQVRKMTVTELTERFKARGVDRQHLPENMTEFFGLFASERQNVLRGVEFIRQSPLLGANVIVHGLLVDVQTGNLEWVSNGYEVAERGQSAPAPLHFAPLGAGEGEVPLSTVNIGEIKMPDLKIGESASSPPPAPPAPARQTIPVPPPVSQPVPIPPPIRIRGRHSA